MPKTAQVTLQPGMRVLVTGPRHPWRHAEGTLQWFGHYGPIVFNWTGWKVRMDDGGSFFAKSSELQIKVKR